MVDILFHYRKHFTICLCTARPYVTISLKYIPFQRKKKISIRPGGAGLDSRATLVLWTWGTGASPRDVTCAHGLSLMGKRWGPRGWQRALASARGRRLPSPHAMKRHPESVTWDTSSKWETNYAQRSTVQGKWTRRGKWPRAREPGLQCSIQILLRGATVPHGWASRTDTTLDQQGP